MMRKLSALGALVALVVSLTAPGADLAYASIKGVSSNSSTVTTSSGTWSVVAVASSTSTGPLTAWTINPVIKSTTGATGSYFSLKNLGTLSMLSASITQTTTGTPTGQTTYTVNLDYCTGTWTVTSGACSGTIFSIMTNTKATTNTGTFTFPTALAAGASIQVRAQYVSSPPQTISDTISISVAQVNACAATTTNS